MYLAFDAREETQEHVTLFSCLQQMKLDPFLPDDKESCPPASQNANLRRSSSPECPVDKSIVSCPTKRVAVRLPLSLQQSNSANTHTHTHIEREREREREREFQYR